MGKPGTPLCKRLTQLAWLACALVIAQAGCAEESRMRSADGPTDSHSATPQAVINALDRLPLVFEENRGQFDASVRYAARASDGVLFLTSTGTTTSLRRDARTSPKTIRMRFAGSRGAQSMLGEDVVEATSNYYIGDDATTWHAGVPHFQRVRARAVYPGIDVVYYGSGPALEYYFVVEPHADPGRIDLAFSGVDTIEIDRGGDLVLRTKHATITHGKPVAYHPTAGERRAVEAHFVKRGAGHVGIRIARYDREKPLVIDPLVLLHATYLGGSSTDKILGIAADPDGSTYVTGLTQSPDFPTLDAPQAGSGGATDVFVAKINAAGTALIYSTYLGGNAIDAALGIARDTSGNAYVAGYTASPNFPVTANPLQASLNGSAYDAFVAKLGPTGALQYSTYLGGTDIDDGECDRSRWRGQRLCHRRHLFAGFPDRERVSARTERRAEWMLRRQGCVRFQTRHGRQGAGLFDLLRRFGRGRGEWHRGRHPGPRVDHGLHLVQQSADRGHSRCRR